MHKPDHIPSRLQSAEQRRAIWRWQWHLALSRPLSNVWTPDARLSYNLGERSMFAWALPMEGER